MAAQCELLRVKLHKAGSALLEPLCTSCRLTIRCIEELERVVCVRALPRPARLICVAAAPCEPSWLQRERGALYRSGAGIGAAHVQAIHLSRAVVAPRARESERSTIGPRSHI